MVFTPFQTGNLTWIPVVIPEVTLPTGSDGITADTFIVSTGAGFVISSSPRWFVALVQFYDFDLSRTTGQPEVSRFRLRYFWQYMVSPKHRIYIMPEFQAVIDRKTREESYWLAPEIGKVITPIQGSKAGFVVYAKPGFGISNMGNSFERDWSFEVGVRWMWDDFPLNPLR